MSQVTKPQQLHQPHPVLTVVSQPYQRAAHVNCVTVI